MIFQIFRITLIYRVILK